MTLIISGSNGYNIAQNISTILKVDHINAGTTKFPDHEMRVVLPSSINRETVFIVHSICDPVNDNLVELLLLSDAARAAGAKHITAIIPYLGYGRQDKAYCAYGSAAAKLIANMIKLSGIQHVITLDLHSQRCAEFFDSIDVVDSAEIFADYVKEDSIFVFPDIGSYNRAKKFAYNVGATMFVLGKRRRHDNSCYMCVLTDNIDIYAKNCIIIDDMIDTGETLCQAAALLKQYGAGNIKAFITHAVLSGDATFKLQNSCITNIFTTNTIPKQINNDIFTVLDISSILAIRAMNLR